MKIWHISDTHGGHKHLQVPDDVDMVIHSGDATNFKEQALNHVELMNFLSWYSKLRIKHKIYVPGNHDSAIYYSLSENKKLFQDYGVDLLVQEGIVKENITIWGSPYTPRFNDWFFTLDRDKMFLVWDQIEDCDVLVTHGPPNGVLDQALRMAGDDSEVVHAGDAELMLAINRVKPRYHLFGHIHNFYHLKNYGEVYDNKIGTTFLNSSMVNDGLRREFSNNGQVFYL